MISDSGYSQVLEAKKNNFLDQRNSVGKRSGQ